MEEPMAQSARAYITSKFQNLSNEALADAIGQADTFRKGAEAECKALKEEFKSRGLFTAAGERFTVTEEVRDICVVCICRGLRSVVENETIVEIPFHHQVMTAKPLYDIMRAIIAEIVSKSNHSHFVESEQIKDLLGYIEGAYSNLYNQRNELLHGTWFIGCPTGADPFAKEFHIKKF